MRRYPSPCFSLYREALEDPCGWPMRRYPSPASLYIGKPERSLWLAYAKISIPCFSLYREALKILVAGICEDTHPLLSLYREALKILVAGLCEDTHPLYLSISGRTKDPSGWPMRSYPFSASLYIRKP